MSPLVALGIGLLLVLVLWTAGSFLSSFLRHPAHQLARRHVVARAGGVEFVEDETDSPARVALHEAVDELAARLVRASSLLTAMVLLPVLLAYAGPPLSRSAVWAALVAGSLVVVGLALVAVTKGFLRPFGAGLDGDQRSVALEDYLGPRERAFAWVACLSSVLVPAGAVLLARIDWYDGSLVWWEGLVAAPATSLALLVVVERSLHRTVDRAPADDTSGLYLWDVFRQLALGRLASGVVIASAMAWWFAAGGLTGVAREPAPRPDWVGSLPAVAVVLGCLLCALLLTPSSGGRSRLRRRLWPDLGDDQQVPLGGAPSS